MIYIDCNLKEFIDKWRLEPGVYNCPKCKKSFPHETPIYLSDMVGLQSKKHGCGHQYSGVILTPRTKVSKDFWSQVI